MIIPLRTDVPLRSRPWVNWALIGLNVAVLLVQLRYPEAVGRHALDPRSPELSEFLSYQFLHAGWMHLILNMLFLYIFGNNVNDRLGHLGYLGLYLGGGVFAATAHVFLTPGVNPLVGASGSVSAVTGAYLALFPRSSITVVYWWFIAGIAEISSLWFILLFFARDVVSHFYPQLMGESNVAHLAHIGGTVFGFGVGLGLLATRLLPRDQYDVLAMVQRWNRRRQYRSLVQRGYDPFAYLPPGNAKPEAAAAPVDELSQRIADLRAQIAEAIAHHNLPHAAILYLDLKTLDPQQVLSRQSQLDVANQLAHQQFFPQAAEAYEQFLRHYPHHEAIEEVQLMLGLIYARYLNQPDRARHYLTLALPRLHAERSVELAQAELARLEPPTASAARERGA